MPEGLLALPVFTGRLTNPAPWEGDFELFEKTFVGSENLITFVSSCD